jgi:hypothetical protein
METAEIYLFTVVTAYGMMDYICYEDSCEKLGVADVKH